MLAQGIFLLLIAIQSTNGQGQVTGIDGNLGGENEFEACWERCYQRTDMSTDMRHYRLAYAGLYDMGMEARRLKNLRSVNGTVVLLDSTLHDYHDPTTNTNLQASETAEAIFNFQRNLATITLFMEGSDTTRNPISIAQFNEYGAITCDTWTCLDTCGAASYLRGGVASTTTNSATANMLNAVQTNSTSHRDGHIEPACRAAYNNLHGSTTCTAEIDREMAIAFLNSDFHDHVHESDEWDDYSPCDEHFDTRYAVGTHAARNMRKLKRWSSLDAHPIYVKDDPYYMEAADQLATCMEERCCTIPLSPLTELSCLITTDHFGEDQSPYTRVP